MKFKFQVLLVVVFAMFSNIYAQELSKTEKKNLKKEIKVLLKDPAKYKLQKESLVVKETIIQDQTEDLIAINNENSKNKNRLDLANDSIALCLAKLELIENKYQTLKTSGGLDDTGMKYKLQVGKYKEFDISSFFEKIKLMTFEKDENGLFVYTIGNFDTEYDAELFKSAVMDLGVKDAFVAYYLDGKRIPKD